MKILCVGQTTYDITLPLDHYPVENKKVKVDQRIECGGGSASICAYMLAKWGMNVYFASVVGNDYYGDILKREMEAVNVNLEYLQTMNSAGTAVSFVLANTSNGSRTILKNREDTLKMYNQEIATDFDVILLDGYEKDVAISVMKRNPNAIKIIDAGRVSDTTVELSHLADYIVCSNDFARDYTGMEMDYDDIESIRKIYDKMKDDFKGNIIITLEDRGSFVFLDDYVIIPSIKVNVVDSTCAGDIYHGAFTYFIANNYDLLETVKLSNITGALSVEKVGGRNSIPLLEEVMDKHNENII